MLRRSALFWSFAFALIGSTALNAGPHPDFSAFGAFAGGLQPPGAARHTFLDAIGRSGRNFCAEDVAKEHFSLSLLRALEARHLTLIREYQPRTGQGIRYGTFDPNWIFKDKQAMSLLIDAFNEDLRVAFPDVKEGVLDLDELVDRWEKEYLLAGGKSSLRWRDRRIQGDLGRKRFLKRLFLTLAFEHFRLRDFGQSGPLPHFTRIEGHDASALPAYACIRRIFGTWDNFQSEFQAYARERRGERVHTTPLDPQPALSATRRAMQDRGLRAQSPLTGTHRRRQDAKTEWDANIEATVESFRTGPPAFALLALFSESTDAGAGGGMQTQLSGNELTLLLEHERDLPGYVEAFNHALNAASLPVIEMGSDARNWYQELVLQLGTARAEQAPGHHLAFQADMPEDELSFINMQDRFVELSGLTLSEINRKVQARLEQRCNGK